MLTPGLGLFAPRRRGGPARVASPARPAPGGLAAAGLLTSYFPTADLTGPAAFARREPLLDFAWEAGRKPGGSPDAAYQSVPADDWSARSLGTLRAGVTETHAFKLTTRNGRARLRIRPDGGPAWTTVVDQSAPGVSTGDHALTAGSLYEVEVEYRAGTGAKTFQLAWSAPSLPERPVDLNWEVWLNNPFGSMLSSGTDTGPEAFVDQWAGAKRVDTPVDAAGWPTGDGSGDVTVYLTSALGIGLRVDPGLVGTHRVTFTGTCNSVVVSQQVTSATTPVYDAGANTTTFDVTVADSNPAFTAGSFTLVGCKRLPADATFTGVTNLSIRKPSAPGSGTPFAAGVTFDPAAKAAYEYASGCRFQCAGSCESTWATRTRGAYANQHRGVTNTSPLPAGPPNDYLVFAFESGPSLERKIQWCNETGSHLLLGLPVLADADYVTRVCQTLLYGSDGTNPYPGPQANPAFPPLNPNLRALLEVGNELWNFAGGFFCDFQHLIHLRRGGDAQLTSWVTYDSEANETTLQSRAAIARGLQFAVAAKAVLGPQFGKGKRFGVAHFWQYANANNTARDALDFADRLVTKRDPASPWPTAAAPLNSLVTALGAADYWAPENAFGTTNTFTGAFGALALSDGLTASPAVPNVTFLGTAGAFKWTSGNGDGIPQPRDGRTQGFYLTGTGGVRFAFTTPASMTSAKVGAVARLMNAPGSSNRVRLILDEGLAGEQDLTYEGPAQGADSIRPLRADEFSGPEQYYTARVVGSTLSTWYSTRLADLSPNTAHTLTVRGQGAGTVFGELFDVTTVDAVFAAPVPAGGLAAGQPAGGFVQTLASISDWGHAFGAGGQLTTYEGGHSTSDDGGNPLQVHTKFFDPRLAAGAGLVADYEQHAGFRRATPGTYSQWAFWNDNAAESGLIEGVTTYPIMAAHVAAQTDLPETPRNGLTAPCRLVPGNVRLHVGAPAAVLSGPAAWCSWNVVVPETGSYEFTRTTTGAGPYELEVDGEVLAAGQARTLTPGLYGVRAVGLSGTRAVEEIGVARAGTVAGTEILTLSTLGDAADLTWEEADGATGYRVRYGTAAGDYTASVAAAGTAAALTGLPTARVVYLAVSAVNASGVGLPGPERTAYLLADGQAGTLAYYLTADAAHTTTSQAADSVVGGLTASGLTRAGWDNGNSFYNGQAGLMGTPNNTASIADYADAVAKGHRWEFTLTPAAGRKFSLTAFDFTAFFSNPNESGASGWRVDYRVGGGSDAAAGSGTVAGTNAFAYPLAVDLSGVSALQNCTQAVRFRVYLFGVLAFRTAGVGGATEAGFRLRGSTGVGPAATGYTLSGPTAGLTGEPATFTLALTPTNPVHPGLTVTPASTGAGAFSPTSVVLDSANPTRTFTYTPAADGPHTVSVTDSGGFADPAAIGYTASAALPLAATFSAADGTALAAYTSDSGHAFAPTAVGVFPADRTPVIGSNRLYFANTTGGAIIGRDAFADYAPPSADYAVEFVLRRDGAEQAVFGVWGRAVGTASEATLGGYMGRYNNLSAEWEVYRQDPGPSYALLGSWAETIPAGETRTARLAFAGTSVKLRVGGVDRVTADDATYAAAGQVGVNCGAAVGVGPAQGVSIDSVQVLE